MLPQQPAADIPSLCYELEASSGAPTLKVCKTLNAQLQCKKANYSKNKTKVISADILDFDFDLDLDS